MTVLLVIADQDVCLLTPEYVHRMLPAARDIKPGVFCFNPLAHEGVDTDINHPNEDAQVWLSNGVSLTCKDPGPRPDRGSRRRDVFTTTFSVQNLSGQVTRRSG